MTLTSALRTATNSLAASARQVSVISKNISSVGDENYVRRDAVVSSGLYGSVSVDVQRRVNQSVYDASISSIASSVSADVIASGFDRISALLGNDNFSLSPASLLEDLKSAVELAASSASNNSSLSSMIEQARTVATSLNSFSSEVSSMRTSADKGVASGVEKINSLLTQLKTINDEVVSGSRIGLDVLDSIDSRDRILRELSEEIGIKVIPREHNDITVLTDSGLTMFEKTPRSVTFQATPVYGPGTTGNALIIDGVVASGPNARLPLQTGKIVGNLELRDNILVQEQRQLDEIARSLIELFAEEDQSAGGVKPKTAGLFTWTGGPTVPASGVLEQGIALSITVNPLVDPQSGGDLTLVRDGGINGDPDYTYNSTGGSGFSDRLLQLASAFNTSVNFDSQAGIPTSQSPLNYARSSLDWLNGSRQSAINNKEYMNELTTRFTTVLQSETGPSLDFEMSRLLEVERGYQASAKLMSIVDSLFSTLMSTVR